VLVTIQAGWVAYDSNIAQEQIIRQQAKKDTNFIEVLTTA